MKISYELIPSSLENVQKQLKWLNGREFDLINIPDIPKFSLRSWDITLSENDFRNVDHSIYHIRAIDFDLNTDSLKNIILNKGLLRKRLLIIKGDSTDRSRQVFDTSVLDMIKKVKEISSEIEVYVAFDPYRQSIKAELSSMNAKAEAGADYFMSQPFFDTNLIKSYSKLFDSSKLFFGISPVVSEASKSYWENVNNVQFPIDFEPTYDWNDNFANLALDVIESYGANAYFMPIKVDLDRYFEPIDLSH